MRLTEKKAIELTIELWTWLAETGARQKTMWPEWDKYKEVCGHCFLCEYSGYREKANKVEPDECIYCPYWKKVGDCMGKDSPYLYWCSEAPTESGKKKYATEFLNQLRQL